jgi:hypothetical protein
VFDQSQKGKVAYAMLRSKEKAEARVAMIYRDMIGYTLILET